MSKGIGNGYCDDGFNKVECNFDGGDCCGSDVNTEYCTNCTCLVEGWVIIIVSTMKKIAREV